MTNPALEDHLLVETTIPARFEVVWDALRDPAKIREWFGWEADSLKDEIDFIFATHARADEAAGTVVFEGVNDRYEVECRGDHCAVRVVRSLPVGQTTEAFDGMIEGWISFTWQLALALARHQLAPRRTLFFSGPPRADRLGRDLLGLDAAPAAGEPWSGALGPETEAAGEVWFTARHQTGVTVDGWGDGLLIVVDQPPTEKKPNGFVMLTLTTYGLDDAALGDLQARWQAWWDERFETAAPGC